MSNGARRTTRRREIPANELTIGMVLRDNVELGAGKMFAFDLFKGETMLLMPIPRPHVPAFTGTWVPRPTTDIDITHLMEWLLANNYVKVGVDKVNRAVDAEGRRNEFSSAQRWLLALPKWDGVDRMEHFWVEVCGAIDNEPGMSETEIKAKALYLRATGRCFFIAIVARIMQPGCKVDTVPVLEGRQGAMKSTLLKKLAINDSWFSDSMPKNLSDKDAMQYLPGSLIVELAEMSQMRASTMEVIKNFLTRTSDKYRPSYGRRTIQQPRQCVFAGTTNSDDYLVDITGNRRFWPIACGDIDIPKACAWLEQLYAEALASFRDGEQWHLPPNIEIIAEDEQRERLNEDPWYDGVMEAVKEKRDAAIGAGEHEYWVTTTEALMKIESKRQNWDDNARKRVAQVLVKIGGKGLKMPRGKGWPRHGYRFLLGTGGTHGTE